MYRRVGPALHSSFQQGGGYSRDGGDGENGYEANGGDAVVDAVVKQLKYLNRKGGGSTLRRHDEDRGGQFADGDGKTDEPGGGCCRPALGERDAEEAAPPAGAVGGGRVEHHLRDAGESGPHDERGQRKGAERLDEPGREV